MIWLFCRYAALPGTSQELQKVEILERHSTEESRFSPGKDELCISIAFILRLLIHQPESHHFVIAQRAQRGIRTVCVGWAMATSAFLIIFSRLPHIKASENACMFLLPLPLQCFQVARKISESSTYSKGILQHFCGSLFTSLRNETRRSAPIGHLLRVPNMTFLRLYGVPFTVHFLVMFSIRFIGTSHPTANYPKPPAKKHESPQLLFIHSWVQSGEKD